MEIVHVVGLEKKNLLYLEQNYRPDKKKGSTAW
jgi:hypothetical protein